MANERKTVYLPRMRTRPGFRHSYQSSADIKVVAVDGEKSRAETKAEAKATSRRGRVVTTGE